MTLFEQWYFQHGADYQHFQLRLMNKTEIAKKLFLDKYRLLPAHIKANWLEHIKDYLITVPTDEFTWIEHFDQFVIWCHERDIQI